MTKLEKQTFMRLDEYRGAPDLTDSGKWYRPVRIPMHEEGGKIVGGPAVGHEGPHNSWPTDEELAKFELAREKAYEFWNAFRDAIKEPRLDGTEYLWTQELYEREERARAERRAAANNPSSQR